VQNIPFFYPKKALLAFLFFIFAPN